MRWFIGLSIAFLALMGFTVAADSQGGNPGSPRGTNPPRTKSTVNTALPVKSGSLTPEPVCEITLCQVSLIEDISIPAAETGRLLAVEIAEGAEVKKGQLLARIDDQQAIVQKMGAELERNAAAERADDDIDIRYAEVAHAKAQAELNDNVAINKQQKGTITVTKIRELELEVQRSALAIDKAKLDHKIAKMTAEVQDAKVRLSDDAIARRQVLAPFDGHVITVHQEQNEWVNAGDPMFRIVRLDQLRVEGLMNAADFNPSELHDRPVTVTVTLAHGRTVECTGKVTFVNPLVQAGNQYRVRAVVENRKEGGHWLLQPGKEAAMRIHL